MIVLRSFYLFIVPFGTVDGRSPDLIASFGTPWFLREDNFIEANDLSTSNFSFGFIYNLDQTIKLSLVLILLLLPFSIFQLLSHV